MAPPSPAAGDLLQRRRLVVGGIVQGVGFRPFVFALARDHGLTGFVGNDSAGVFIEVQGTPSALGAFQRQLASSAPPLAQIESVTVEELPIQPEQTFEIVASALQPGASTPISPDIATCDDCLRELFAPTDRRYRYPFINCTHCGPRFTIIRDIPYDRPLTTMSAFPMCPACAAEYHDPTNRRFHAQPNACPECGPIVSFVGPGNSQEARGDEALSLARRALDNGLIVAIKGIGGFHLACDGTDDQTVRRLRDRKGRIDKPFALMMQNLEVVRRYATVDEEEARLLSTRERPIVLLKRRVVSEAIPLSPQVAPGNDYLGIMLPYTPLHHLLMDERPLILTSGNLSDEPIVKDNDAALRNLAPLADAFLLHDRDIHVVCDDSVVRVFAGQEYPIRRSRGYAPMPVPLPRRVPTVLAVGGELKATFCLTRGHHAYLSQHVGDMENLETLRAFEQGFAHFQALFRATPERIVCDAHPGYLSSRWAAEFALTNNLPLQRVQHHHAHIAAVMADHGLDGSQPVIGFSFDGTGYGTDGGIWGGEVMLATYASFQRVAHLKNVPLPGGDASIKRPYRAALAHLWAAGMPWQADWPCVAACSAVERRVLLRQLEDNVQCVPTSSMGRFFDAVAALLGIRQVITYEAQGSIEMEAIAASETNEAYTFSCSAGEPIAIDPGDVLRGIAADLEQHLPVAMIAAKFHRGVAELIAQLAVRLREGTGLGTVALSGGVFQNGLLLRLSLEELQAAGFEVLIHHRVPANDGGLALGQAAIACLGSADRA
jgi:hydrogenase maturation protein HypF